ncbi:hypothetical protein COU19_03080 [Candidatus Kaiserbacteria bacterium CG10_big_fil_rev_8_21_14_0_10_56_12]|uniref:Uncharacterized protein n=1 Tax=Candidatus Kaiserbacteria bacterium CG10_big_fil_rev_8_21_14_0_10_56_12 TaxID=1974611 RepID=A0A2H0U993_9BACT|nr:MAG: hypothetical protein COU19_03080 [Candidatus Kaiserbacteria bacterium CG10_big_fil_rev_8_21_14_0_10_56_12]
MAISPEERRIRGFEATARAAAITAGETAATTEADREIRDHEAARIAAATAEGREEGYRRGLRANRARLDTRAENLGIEPQGWFRRLGARYNRMKMCNKIFIAGGLIGGAVTFGSLIPMIALGAKIGLGAQRLAAFAGIFHKTEQRMENARAGSFFARRTNGERALMAATLAGVYTLGISKVIGEAFHYAGETSWAHTATDWLRGHWPIKSGMFSLSKPEVMGPPAPHQPQTGAPVEFASAHSTHPGAPSWDQYEIKDGMPEYQVLDGTFGIDHPLPPLDAAAHAAAPGSAAPSLDHILHPDPIVAHDVVAPEHPLTSAPTPDVWPGSTHLDTSAIEPATPAEYHEKLADLLKSKEFLPHTPEPLATPVPQEGSFMASLDTPAAAHAPSVPSVPLEHVLHPDPLVPEQPTFTPGHVGEPQSFAEFNATAPAPEAPDVVGEAGHQAAFDHLMHPEPLVAHDTSAPEHPFTPAPETVDPNHMSFAQFEAGNPAAAPELPTITTGASAGHGYEFMTKRLWMQLQDKHLDPSQYAKGSDLRTLIETKPADIDAVAHNLATSHGFYHSDGTNTLIPPNSHVSFDTQGQIHFGDPAHHIDVIQSPVDAKVTPPYHPEMNTPHPEAQLTHIDNADTHTSILYNNDALVTPADHVQPQVDASHAQPAPQQSAVVGHEALQQPIDVPVNLSETHGYVSNGQLYVLGGDKALIDATAQDYALKHHVPVLVDKSYKLLGIIPTPRFVEYVPAPDGTVIGVIHNGPSYVPDFNKITEKVF